MENTEKIVFLYDEKSIPDQIIEAAKAQTPSGFELVLCESKMVKEERRLHTAQADYFMLYTVGFEDIDIAKKAKLMQILNHEVIQKTKLQDILNILLYIF